mmetsp:Transcript_9885/g.17789  ORF Transcript_9885/g.17789 Transcript_9885/m.17789 type:complete len:237 (-) Transcript_9885:82-792(-)
MCNHYPRIFRPMNLCPTFPPTSPFQHNQINVYHPNSITVSYTFPSPITNHPPTAQANHLINLQLFNLSKRQSQSTSHSLIYLHFYGGDGSIDTPSLCGGCFGFGSLEVGSDGDGIEVIDFDGLGTDNVRSRPLMSQRKSTRNKILLIPPILMLNRHHTRLQLGHNGNVISRHFVLPHGSRHDDRLDIGGIIKCFLGEVEVECHETRGSGRGGELPAQGGRCGGAGGGAAEDGEHHG